MPKTPTCVVCGIALTPLDARTAPTCGAVACRWTYETRPAGHACRVCSRPLGVSERAEGLCATPECHHAWAAQRRFVEMRERRRRDRTLLEARGHELRALGATAGVAGPASYPIAYIPRYRGRVTALPQRRLRLHREHLQAILDRALEPPPPDAAPPEDSTPEPTTPALAALLGRACGQCRGECCSNGGIRAYLSAGSMRRYLAEHPELTPAAVLDRYLAHVPARTYRDSCVYHRPGGCNLPRDMRADVCNRFYCGGLSELRRALPADEPPRAFIVAAAAPEVVTGVFATADGPLRRVRRPLPVLPAGA